MIFLHSIKLMTSLNPIKLIDIDPYVPKWVTNRVTAKVGFDWYYLEIFYQN